MDRNEKYSMLMVSFLLTGLAFPFTKVQAFCPICTLCVCAGVGLSRWLGIDDTITGLWIGAFTASLIGWTINWFNKINFRFHGRKILTTVVYYALVIGSLYYTKMIGDTAHKFLGLDKLILGIIIGTFAFLFAVLWYEHLKRKNLNHAYFPMQKVVMPVVTLLLLSALFYFLTK